MELEDASHLKDCKRICTSFQTLLTECIRGRLWVACGWFVRSVLGHDGKNWAMYLILNLSTLYAHVHRVQSQFASLLLVARTCLLLLLHPSTMNTSTSEQEYTILRIKRKRDDEVPDVLGSWNLRPQLPVFTLLSLDTVVDKKGQKRRKSGLNVFQFAETVDEATWKQLEQEELRVCLFIYDYAPCILTNLNRNAFLSFQNQVPKLLKVTEQA